MTKSGVLLASSLLLLASGSDAVRGPRVFKVVPGGHGCELPLQTRHTRAVAGVASRSAATMARARVHMATLA